MNMDKGGEMESRFALPCGIKESASHTWIPRVEVIAIGGVSIARRLDLPLDMEGCFCDMKLECLKPMGKVQVRDHLCMLRGKGGQKWSSEAKKEIDY